MKIKPIIFVFFLYVEKAMCFLLFKIAVQSLMNLGLGSIHFQLAILKIVKIQGNKMSPFLEQRLTQPLAFLLFLKPLPPV